MKCQSLSATLAAAIVAVLNSGADACTGVRLIANDVVVVGRTMEFGFDVQSNVVVVPAGTKLTNSLADPSRGLTYTTKYGMIGANILGMKVIVDGVNEKGL